MEKIEELLKKLRNGSCTLEELKELKALFEEGDGLQAHLDEDLERIAYQASDAQRKKVWSQIEVQMQTEGEEQAIVRPTAKIRKLVYRWASAAAILLLAFFVWDQFGGQQPASTIVVENKQINDIEKFTLPDGSRVWLNKHSTLTYPSSFEGEVRLITLEGEAFFEVKTDTAQPFIVKTADVQTRVLGTSFNVRAYATDDLIEVALVEGKVQVQIETYADTTDNMIALTPGKQFSYSKSQRAHATNPFTNDKPYVWRDGIVFFDGADIHEVTNTLQRWYDVEFTLQDDSLMTSELVYRYDTKKFTLHEVLRHITEVTDYKFESITGDKYLVRPK